MRAAAPRQLRSGCAPARAHASAGGDQLASSAPPARCPFALASSFVLPDNQRRANRLSPLGQALFSEPPASVGASLWLSHGMPGQDTPNRLVSGLRRLTHVEEWLTLVPATHAAELGMKRRAHDERLSSVCVAEPQSLAAQAECLEAFLDYLPKRYPESYSLAGAGAERAIAVAATGERHRVADFAACPLELCGRLVQEDLALMRALPEHERGADAAGNRHVLSAASVVFSFGGLADKMGKPLAFLHAPVPGYEADMAKLLNRTFDAIEVDKPFWRNNWGIANSGQMDSHSYGTPEALEGLKAALAPSDRFLQTEYETIRRLPASRFVLFTIKGFKEPVASLGRVPGAAATLAESIRGMSPSMRAYKGLASPEATADMLLYLDALDRQAATGASSAAVAR